jgi:hypothetical protein
MAANYNTLTDPASIHANQNGQITREQSQALKSKLSGLPGWLTVALMFALIALAAVLGGKTLTRSTPLAIAVLVAVILVTFAITAFLGNLLGGLRMALTRKSIEQAHGQVTWDNNRYAAIANGRTLDPIDGSNLQPGGYTFFLLRGTRYALSAQRDSSLAAAVASTSAGLTALAPAPTAPTDLKSLKALLDKPLDFDPRLEPDRAARHVAELTRAMQDIQASDPSAVSPEDIHEIQSRLLEQGRQLVHGQSFKNLVEIAQESIHLTKPQFDSQEVAQLANALEQVGVRHTSTLATNRDGKQSARQRGQLLKDISSNLFWSAVVGLGWLVLTAIFITQAKWTGMLAVSAFFLLILAMLLSSARNEMRDFAGGRVEFDEGWVTKYTRDIRGRTHHTLYYYRINGNGYEVSKLAYDALIEGNYRLYYLPNTHKLVNLDPLLPEGNT